MIGFILGFFARGVADDAAAATSSACRRVKKDAVDWATNTPGSKHARRRLKEAYGRGELLWTDGDSYIAKNGDCDLAPDCDVPDDLRRKALAGEL